METLPARKGERSSSENWAKNVSIRKRGLGKVVNPSLDTVTFRMFFNCFVSRSNVDPIYLEHMYKV